MKKLGHVRIDKLTKPMIVAVVKDRIRLGCLRLLNVYPHAEALSLARKHGCPYVRPGGNKTATSNARTSH